MGFASAITTDGLRGITWQGIRNGRFDNRGGKKIETFDVLIAYPSFAWNELAPVSIFMRRQSMANEPQDADDIEESEPDASATASKGFQQVAQTYINALREKVPAAERNKKYVHLLLLRAISPGQVQLIFSASPTCAEFDQALNYWSASESYLPDRLRIPLPSKKKEGVGWGWFRPRLLFPDEAIRVFTHQWKREGTDSHRIQAPPVGDIFNVFLRRAGHWEQSARELLETLIPRIEPLLIAAGQRLHLTDSANLKEWQDFLPKTAQGQPDKRLPDPRYSLSQALSLLGTLLHALSSENSLCMKETAYRLGRLLAAMDKLHKCYCDCERLDAQKRPSYPPTLIGNGLLGRAADSPEEALAELCERGRIYLGWADTVQPKPLSQSDTGKEESPDNRHNVAVFSARKLLRIVSPVCAELHQADLSKLILPGKRGHENRKLV